MAKESRTYVPQSGVIPYRIKDGRLQVALVTASSGPHWTIPKGHIEPKMTAQESAAKEAYEESGLVGDVEHRCVGTYIYLKRGRLRQVSVYPLEVKHELRVWPERHVRQRKWMSIDAAASRVRSEELRGCIQRLPNLVKKAA